MSAKINVQEFKTPVGILLIGSFQNKLCLCDWQYRKMRVQIDNRIQQFLNAEYFSHSDKTIENTQTQLSEYFNSQRTEFELPLLFTGSDFQKKVWEELSKIPFGKTVSYLSLAKNIGNEKAVRAVAAANGANAISIIVPCHRVIGGNGKLVGYAGGINAKQKLLQLENKRVPELF
ncbi:MAG: methylated-DNA--[protein]-cysteine S-methyltransferase [Chitinophagales bacterium]|nr:methylated-DNA--[protein]-cysteine S-methyltransferase [Chitinophagales bacterium]OJV24347.1 MAG: cysteine methyltransferase [Bacteroidetes bacterium 37-13]